MTVLNFTLKTTTTVPKQELVFSQNKNETTIFWKRFPIDGTNDVSEREIKFERIQQSIVEALGNERLNAEIEVPLTSDSDNSRPSAVDFRIYNDPEANFNTEENGVVLQLEDWTVVLRLSDVTEILSNFNYIIN